MAHYVFYARCRTGREGVRPLRNIFADELVEHTFWLSNRKGERSEDLLLVQEWDSRAHVLIYSGCWHEENTPLVLFVLAVRLNPLTTLMIDRYCSVPCRGVL